MERRLSRVKGFNILLGMLIIVMLAFFLIFTSYLITPIVSGTVDLFTVASAVFLALLCLPLSVHLYQSSKNPDMRLIFLALAFDFFLLSLSGALWYVIPEWVDMPWILDLGKIVMIIAYVPPLAALFYLFNARVKRNEHNYSFITLTSVVSTLLILLFVGLNFYRAPGDGFDIAVYTLSIVIDITLLTMSSMLAINYMQNQFRYIFSVLIVYFLLALAGDAFNLLSSLGLYSRPGDVVYVYLIMFIFMAVSLLFFTLSRIKITTVEEVDQQLRDTLSLMQDLIMQSPDAICIFDLDGEIVQANPQFLQLISDNHREGPGKLNLFRDTDQLIKSPAGTIDKVREGSIAIYEGSAPQSSRSDRRGHYSVKIFPTVDARGTITSYIMFVMDITEQKSREAELQIAKDNAELYLDLMGHDINNMHQIALGYLEVARDMQMLNEEQKLLIDKPFEVLERSARLIQNVRKLQKLKEGVFQDQVVDVRAVLEDVQREFGAVPDKSVKLNLNGYGQCHVRANELLHDVFANLVSNAIKHTGDRSEINIGLDIVKENGGQYCRVMVEDGGRGIPDDFKGKVFNRMLKGTTKAKGMGLGLYLVKSLVDSYGGRVWVEDRVVGDHTKGARFVVMLPAIEK